MAKLMLVEDDNNLREIYGARLMAEGYEIISAADGEEALALAVKEKPDLIISDVMMPKISGFDMLDILRTTPETKNTKVIMMTALSQPEDRQRGEALGADKYLVKSQVTLEDVVAAVHEILGDGGSSSGVNETLSAATQQGNNPTPPSSQQPNSSGNDQVNGTDAQQPQPASAAQQTTEAVQPQAAATPQSEPPENNIPSPAAQTDSNQDQITPPGSTSAATTAKPSNNSGVAQPDQSPQPSTPEPAAPESSAPEAETASNPADGDQAPPPPPSSGDTPPPAVDNSPKAEGANQEAPEPPSRKKKVISPINNMEDDKDRLLKLADQEGTNNSSHVPGNKFMPENTPDIAAEKAQMEAQVKDLVSNGTLDKTAGQPQVANSPAPSDKTETPAQAAPPANQPGGHSEAEDNHVETGNDMPASTDNPNPNDIAL